MQYDLQPQHQPSNLTLADLQRKLRLFYRYYLGHLRLWVRRQKTVVLDDG
jgi:hypothetical protein